MLSSATLFSSAFLIQEDLSEGRIFHHNGYLVKHNLSGVLIHIVLDEEVILNRR